MRLLAFGGDERMDGAMLAARRAGWDAAHIRQEADAVPDDADAVMLPWPVSFKNGYLTGSGLEKARALGMLPPCRVLLHGGGTDAQELANAERLLDPGREEAFLRVNAQLTAEGAIARAMARYGRSLLRSACLVTGFGRIAQELTARLCAMGAFVIVCARSEAQMQRAHEAGAHPMPFARLARACAQADVIFNTVPAQVFGEAALLAIGRDALYIELASAPYGLSLELAAHLGIEPAIEKGLPGRYAPLDAGAAMFDLLLRVMAAQDAQHVGEKKGAGADE